MKSKTTIFWLLLALVLATTIWGLNRFFQPAAPGEKPLFPGLIASRVTALQVIPAGGREISVVSTNHAWQLKQPLVYPAQSAAIDGLLGALEKLTPVLSLSPAETTGRKNADAEFGFDSPQFKLDIEANGTAWHLMVGNKTAPGDGVYVRVVGTSTTCITDTAWLQYLPHDAGDWRDTTLVEVPDNLDWLLITNGTQTVELRRNGTNHLWRIMRPLPARANNLFIAATLERLRGTKVSRFVSDDPKADLTAYGLDPAGLDIWLGSGTNLLTAVHAGKDVSGMPGELYARREGWPTVVSMPKTALNGWRTAVNDLRATNLIELSAPVTEVEMRGENNNYTLQLRSNAWTAVGEKFPIDPIQVATLIRTLAGLQIVDFVQDVVTPAGLQSYGLAKPSQQITLRSVAGDTNSVIARILLGGTTNNEIFVKRADEEYVYALSSVGMGELSLPGDYFRDHRIWSFSPADVTGLTLRQNGKVQQLVHNGTNDWTLAAGSQGIITPPAVEEAVYRLGSLTAFAWIGRKFPESEVGLATNNLSLTVELKSGEKLTLDFGKEIQLLPKGTALAVVTMEGERWAFIFPPVLWPMITENLTIRANAP